jgi:CxxC motif-containing protein (DUF1111 family)
VVRRLALVDGEASEHLPFGNVVRPRAITGAEPLLPPDDPSVREELRLGPAVFGRGYLEAVSDAQLLAWEAEQRERGDGISGRAHRVARQSAVELPSWLPELGRFGLKARIASLDEFVADALVGDMGITSPLRPVEPPNPSGMTDDGRPGVDVDRNVVAEIADYVRFLAIPLRTSGVDGAELFEQMRCGVCHVPSVRTRDDHPVPALRDVEVALFTDLLLHDMGEGLADGIADGDASPREWRTAPLMGLRHQRRLLHDGRAQTVADAIEAHASEGSEANDSVARVRALSSEDRNILIAYVESL